MSESSNEQLKAESVTLLRDLGLSENEALVFTKLLRLAVATARQITESNGVPRSAVYKALDSLHEKGLVDIQYTSPRKFTAVSRETAIRKLELRRQNTLAELKEVLYQLESVEQQTEEFGVWTVTGTEAVATRVLEFIDDADVELIYMTVDELLTQAHLDALRNAEERGVEIFLAGISEEVKERIQEQIPSATVFETLWEWSEAGAGSLLITDKRTALVSVLVDGDSPAEFEEMAIWGQGTNNSLVVVLRAIFTWRLGDGQQLTNTDGSV